MFSSTAIRYEISGATLRSIGYWAVAHNLMGYSLQFSSTAIRYEVSGATLRSIGY